MTPSTLPVAGSCWGPAPVVGVGRLLVVLDEDEPEHPAAASPATSRAEVASGMVRNRYIIAAYRRRGAGRGPGAVLTWGSAGRGGPLGRADTRVAVPRAAR